MCVWEGEEEGTVGRGTEGGRRHRAEREGGKERECKYVH